MQNIFNSISYTKTKIISRLICLISFLSPVLLNAQNIQPYLKSNEKRILSEYFQFLSIPNVATDSENIKKNTEFIAGMMKSRGLQPIIMPGYTLNAVPAIFTEVKTPGAKKTIGFYAHYDGQPVNAKQWFPGLGPFTPMFATGPFEQGGKIIGPFNDSLSIDPEWRITGRGSADDKAGVMAILNAYELLVKMGKQLKINIKILFEGEEEAGSTHLNEIFEQNRKLLTADCWVVIDGPRYISGRKTIAFGARGDINVALTAYGAIRPLHSGNYGNWAPNPAWGMVQLLASMKDEKGDVTIPGFYDDVTALNSEEKEAIRLIPNYDQYLKNELGILETESPGRSLSESIMLPGLNINGLQSANVGSQAANVIPNKAEAVLDLRLVKGNDYKRQVNKIREFLVSKNYHVIDREPTDEERKQYARIIKLETNHGYNAQRTAMNLPVIDEIIAKVKETTKEPLVLLPSIGGSLPLYLFEELLNTKVITIPIVNYDNNQHAQNENVKIKYLWEGIETIASIMQMK